MVKVRCTDFVICDYEEWTPCICPVCKGFLPRDFPIGTQFQCRKCGAVLETLPHVDPDLDKDEQDDDMEWGGRICKVPDYAVKISIKKFPRPRKDRRKKTNKWAMGFNFIRRVWKDKDGEFITIPERIGLDDPRVLRVGDDLYFQGEKVNG